MKKILFTALLFFTVVPSRAQTLKSIDLNFIMYDASIFFPAFDLELGLPFWQKGGFSFAFVGSVFFYIPSSPSFPSPSYLGFGFIPQIQSRLQKKGFWASIETGLGIFGEFKTVEIFIPGQGFQRDKGTPYGMFSLSGRLGYEFSYRYKQPFVLSFVIGYRLQFPYNLSLNHIILLGFSFGYTFPLK